MSELSCNAPCFMSELSVVSAFFMSEDLAKTSNRRPVQTLSAGFVRFAEWHRI